MSYKQLTSEQRSQIFVLLQKKTPRKEIALLVGCSQATLSRELKRNTTDKGNYLWEKAHIKALERRKRTTSNKKFDQVLVWRIVQMITEYQLSPEQTKGVLAKDGVSVSIQSIYNIINADVSGELLRHRRHTDFNDGPYMNENPRKRPILPIAPVYTTDLPEANGKRFGDLEMNLIVDSDQHTVLVLVESSTNFVMMERLKYGKKPSLWQKPS